MSAADNSLRSEGMAVYLITGGGRGIGSGIARRLVAEGGTVIIAGKETRRVAGARSIICDISDSAQVASLLMGVEILEGKLDGLICDAAHLPHVFRLVNAAAPLLRAASGAEVTLTSPHAATEDVLASLSASLGPKVRVSCLVE
jgi:NAD(P)-dependent dehydrogenase (short-subunit alcohol dehydrogenase family)